LRIAVSGKGGVGKTTIAGCLARLMARCGQKVVAIDADPDANLAYVLGVPPEKRAKITPLSQMLDLIEERTGMRPGSQGGLYCLNPKVDDILDRYGVQATDGVQLLVLGGLQTPGTGCFCPENALLKALLRHLVLQKDQHLVLDLEAGIEHLARGTAEKMDVMLVVVEPGIRSIETAIKIKNLAKQLGVKRIMAVLNKMRNKKDIKLVENKLLEAGIPPTCTIPYEEGLVEADLGDKQPEILKLEIAKRLEQLKNRLFREHLGPG